MRRFVLGSLAVLAITATPAFAQPGNLLRNGDFQDDWITFLPQTKNHHWCYSSEFYNRRDYNPDGWYLKGSWEWQNADGPRGERKFVMKGPSAEAVQRVNWITIHDDRQIEGFPDAGGFPGIKVARSQRPERLMRDLTLEVRLTGENVPKDAGAIELGLCPPGGTSSADPHGTMVAPIIVRSIPIPEGNTLSHNVQVKLAAADWLAAARGVAAKDAKEAAEVAKSGIALPATVIVAIRYKGKAGSIWVRSAKLTATDAPGPNLLKNGGFEDLDKDGYPAGWTKALKYRYFPPRHYYIFNTWHNTNFPNRGFAAADSLIPRFGKHSLRMIVPPGDEQMVLSDPITLNQKEPRLIEVSAWVMTDRLCMLQIDATDEKGHRLDGFNFIHKAPVSIGTDGWRQLRQVFRPGTPVKSLRLALCARGVNGYTLDGTGSQPQANVVGHIWWDEVKLTEPESDAAELAARGVKEAPAWENVEGLRIIDLDPGERLIGENFLRATVVNSGSPRTVSVRWEIGTSVHRSPSKQVGASPEVFEIPYQRFEASPHIPPYSATRSRFSLVDGDDTVATSDLWLDLWTVPIDLQLGALYLQPQQKQSVRMNLGLSQKTLSAVKRVRLDVTHRGTQYRVKQVFKSFNVEATPTAIREQREKMPPELRGDLRNLIIADLDLPFVPASAFADPKQEWFIRAIVLREDGKVVTQIDSRLFGRLAHEPPQAAIQSVAIKGNLVYVNGQPWIPFGVCYGHNPVYAGPADPGSGKYLDLHNLPGWSMYDQHNSASSSRKQFDFNCMRYVAGSITDHKTLAKRWQDDNLYCSSAFAIPQPAFSLPEVFKLAGGKDKLDAYLAQCKASPYVVSIAPGIEEAFGLFQGATPAQIKGMEEVVDYMRRQSGKPVMCGHGGYWNRLEFEKVPFFDIYDPETEPLYPANIHTDLAPLLNRAATVRERGGAALADARGSDKVIWLRPQMYESVPYERWRFHTYVELMRGCRGWQIAHGPGDASLFRGLHGEIEFWKPIVASKDPGPQVTVEPWIEHWSRKHNGKTYIIAATTHGIPFGKWETSDDAPPGSKHSRLTAWRHELRDESNAYGIGEFPETGPAFHGIQYLPDARAWPKGTKIVQWVKLGKEPLSGLVILAKADGRWTHAASWGKVDLGKLRKNPDTAYWFLNTAYRHAKGFLGWGKDLLPKSLDYIPDKATDFGSLPPSGEWVKLEIPLETIGADGKLLDGVGFLCEGGPATWGKTSIVAPDGAETLVWGDTVQRSPEELAKVKITVPGLAKGSKVRVLFEDREIAADDGYFIDDFRGQDQYQRYGGGWGTGYGDAPVALHLYAVATK